jgi:hypothetical protein
MILKNLGNFEDNWSTFDRVIKCPMSYCCCPLTLDSIANYPGLDLQSKLLRKTIKECGTYSMSESKKITNIPATSLLIDKKIGLVGLFIKNKFPAVYYYIKKIIAKIKNN